MIGKPSLGLRVRTFRALTANHYILASSIFEYDLVHMIAIHRDHTN